MEKYSVSLEETYSHLIYFFAQTEHEAESIVETLKKHFDISLYKLQKTNRSSYKVKIAVHKNDVCDVACQLTSLRKQIYIYNWSDLAAVSKENTENRKRFHRDFAYLCTKLKDDDKKSYEDVALLIDDETIFENVIIKESYQKLCTSMPEDDIKRKAYGILAKIYKMISDD